MSRSFSSYSTRGRNAWIHRCAKVARQQARALERGLVSYNMAKGAVDAALEDTEMYFRHYWTWAATREQRKFIRASVRIDMAVIRAMEVEDAQER